MDYENLKTIEINNKEYKVIVCETEEDRAIGLSQTSELLDSEGCLFIFDSPIPAEDVVFTCASMDFNLDLLFLNSEGVVVDKQLGKAGSEDPISPVNVAPDMDIAYVIELNAGSNVNVGDEVDLDLEDATDEEVDAMYILGPDGEPQAKIFSNVRIFSRIHTKELIKKAKKARKSKSDRDYKNLGKAMFKMLNIQDNQESQYVSLPE